MVKTTFSLFTGMLLGMLIWAHPLLAQNKGYISDFTLTDGAETSVSLSDFQGKKAVVVVFTSSHCSWAVKYEGRLQMLYDKYKTKDVAFIAINSNDASMSRRDEASQMTRNSSYSFQYLKDGDQAVAKQFGATKNPEVFVLRPDGGKFKIIYQGKIDDNPLDASLVKHHYLEDALDCVILGKEPGEEQTTPNGCNIKWK
ncbi:thioredoxin family protein [Pontibacter sp. G13]|uniref:thioredoxin family protein n=1 Tax=Pontibacter sp. G13 TaxID=3074898 RepID=UPI00288C55B9|nr:thioredoxin family protein [Pontibacter sp. G13]WNJ20783.1 thioredoxin family protein [Pontibacter sp. G13]